MKNVLKIIKDKNKLLRDTNNVNIDLDYKKVSKVCHDLKDTLLDYPDLCALSSVNLDSSYRIIALKFKNRKVEVLINPFITKRDEMVLSRETCPGVEGEYIMPRFDEIEVTFMKEDGEPTNCKFKGYASYLIQQQVDLLDGVMIDDLGLPVLEGFDDLSEEDKQTVIDLWLQSLEQAKEDLDKEIQSSEGLKKVVDAIEFETQVALGNVTFEK